MILPEIAALYSSFLIQADCRYHKYTPSWGHIHGFLGVTVARPFVGDLIGSGNASSLLGHQDPLDDFMLYGSTFSRA